jgi:hypothetical protein
MLFKEDIADLCVGFWGRREYVVDPIDLVALRFEIEADRFIECARHSFGIRENAINYSKRTDRPKLSSISNGLRSALCR